MLYIIIITLYKKNKKQNKGNKMVNNKKTMMQMASEIITDYCTFYDYILKNKIEKNFDNVNIKNTELYYEIMSISNGIKLLKQEINNFKNEIKEKNKNSNFKFINLNLINDQIEKLFNFEILNNCIVLRNLELLKNRINFFYEIYKILSLNWDNLHENILFTDEDKKKKFSVLFA